MQSLAVKYRPDTFDDVVEQSAIKIILTQQVATSTFKHAYLFTGPAGCGKTTAARIFADMLNESKGTPYEIDAASNNGVDNIRDIIDNARRKALDTKYKVYIIDECHMLSIGAWNAMLKLLEEAPSGTIFILCTTDPQKVPATILSRVQRYDFTKIPTEYIFNRLVQIITWENEEMQDPIEYTDDALMYIAKLAEGGMRDAITMLDQCISYSLMIDTECVLKVLGTVDYDTLFHFLDVLTLYDLTGAMALIDTVYNAGKDISTFLKQFQYFIVDVCKFKMFGTLECTRIPQTPHYEELSSNIEFASAVSALEWAKGVNNTIKWEQNPKALIESAVIIACVNQAL